jgi:CheY-like chemotaxis protein
VTEGAAAPGGRLILVVDDDAVTCALLRDLCMALGHEAVVAADGDEALACVAARRPDLVLLDLMMPGMNGDEMLMKVREQEWGADVRVIILTNISRDEAPSVLRFLNVDRYIVKAHYTPGQVVEIVNEVLHIR